MAAPSCARGVNDLANHGEFNEGAHRIVDHHDIRFRRGLIKAPGHGFLPRRATRQQAHSFGKILLGNLLEGPIHFFRPHPQENLVDRFGSRKLPQGVNENRHALEGEKLFGRSSAHPYARTRRWNNG